MTAPTPGRDLALWTGLLTGPVVWFLSLEAKFALAPWVCAFGWKPAVILLSIVALALIGMAGLLSWSQWRQLEGTESRACAMAFGGMFLNAGLLIVIIAQALPELILAGCE